MPACATLLRDPPTKSTTVAGALATDVDLYVNVNLALSQQAGLVARYSGAGDKNYYLASLTTDASKNVVARLARNVNGVVTPSPVGVAMLKLR